MILAVDQRDQPICAGSPRRFHVAGDLRVVGRGGHEKLDAVAAGLEEGGDIVEHRRRGLAKDRVQEDIGDSLRAHERRFALQSGAGRLAMAEEGHVPERGNPARQCRRRPAGEVVDPARFFLAAGWQGEVDMCIDPAGQDEFADGIEFPIRRHLAADLRHAPIDDTEIGPCCLACGHDGPATNDQSEGHGVLLYQRMPSDSAPMPPATTNRSCAHVASPFLPWRQTTMWRCAARDCVGSSTRRVTVPVRRGGSGTTTTCGPRNPRDVPAGRCAGSCGSHRGSGQTRPRNRR